MVSIPNGLPRPFHPGLRPSNTASSKCFNPERASQAFPTSSGQYGVTPIIKRFNTKRASQAIPTVGGPHHSFLLGGFQSRTGFPGHSDTICTIRTYFRCRCFNPERASQAIPTVSFDGIPCRIIWFQSRTGSPGRFATRNRSLLMAHAMLVSIPNRLPRPFRRTPPSDGYHLCFGSFNPERASQAVSPRPAQAGSKMHGHVSIPNGHPRPFHRCATPTLP